MAERVRPGVGTVSALAEKSEPGRRSPDVETQKSTGSAGGAPPRPPRRSAVWKSTGPEGGSPVAGESVNASQGDFESLQKSLTASLTKSIQSSVQESLQASLHAELAEVRRQLRGAEQQATADRKQQDHRHTMLLKSVESGVAVSKEATDSASINSKSVLRDAQERADTANKEAKEAVAARLEAEVKVRERELQLERLKEDHKKAMQIAEEAAKTKLSDAAKQAEFRLSEGQASAEKQVEAAASEAAASEAKAAARVKETLARRAVDREALVSELASSESEVKKAEAEAFAAGEKAAEGRLEPEIAQSKAAAGDFAKEINELESATAELAKAKTQVEADRVAVESERDANRSEMDQWKRMAREQLAAEREALVSEIEAMRASAGREAAGEALEKQASDLLAERVQLKGERLEMDALSLTLSREAAAARTELAQVEDQSRIAHESLAAQWKALEAERLAIGALLEKDRAAYAEALHKERESAAAAFAAAEASHSEGTSALRQHLAEALASAKEEAENSSLARASQSALDQEAGKMKLQLTAAAEEHDATVAELDKTKKRLKLSGEETEQVKASLKDLQKNFDVNAEALVMSLTRDLRALESETRRAKESEMVARTAMAQSESVMGIALEQLSAEAAAAKGIADERIATAEGELAWHKTTLTRQLDETRSALETASASLVKEQSAVFALRSMMLVADADVASMRGAAAHYAALGGGETGSLREALSRAEVGRREAVEAERRRCDELLTRECENFDGVLGRLRESSFAVQAKLTSQLAWLEDALEERTRQLHAEREGFDAALAKERAATATANDEARRVLAEVADRQAARHAAEISDQGTAMEAQLAVEREAFLEQLVDHKEINAHLADARAEARAAKLELSELRTRYSDEVRSWTDGASKARDELLEERKAHAHATQLAVEKAEAQHAAMLAKHNETHRAERDRDAYLIASLESQLSGVNEALERERDSHSMERTRWGERVQELETRGQARELDHVHKTTSELEQQLSEATKTEEALRNRLRSVTAAASAEVERGTTQVSELHDARQRQLRLEHAQLAELHSQSSTALKAMAEQREAMRLEADAHRRTQEQLLALHETMQKERDAFAMEVAGDRDARVQLPIVLAELGATRKLLEEMGRDAAERRALGKEGGARSPKGRPPSALGRPSTPKGGKKSQNDGGGLMNMFTHGFSSN